MASTKDIRRRIKSVKSTRQITKAMEMVASAKMRKAQLAALATRAYARLAWELIENLGDKTHPRMHALLRRPLETKTTGIVLLTSNRGLIGAFNNLLIAEAVRYGKACQHPEFITMGAKGLTALKKFGFHIATTFEKKDTIHSVTEIRPLMRLLIDDFTTGRYDKIVLVYMNFANILQHKPVVLELLPLPATEKTAQEMFGWDDETVLENEELTDFLFEPGADQVLETLLPRLVESQIYQALLETNAAEHSARMIAMKNASDAALDLVDELTFEYNQLRQASITKEISEIVAGQLILTK